MRPLPSDHARVFFRVLLTYFGGSLFHRSIRHMWLWYVECAHRASEVSEVRGRIWGHVCSQNTPLTKVFVLRL